MAYKVGDEVRFHTGARIVLTLVNYDFDEFEGKTDQGTVLKFPGKFLKGHIKDEPVDDHVEAPQVGDTQGVPLTDHIVSTVVSTPASRGGGQKFDSGKPQARLLFEDLPLALNQIMMVMSEAINVKGYLPHSWQTVPNAEERYADAKYRHMLKRIGGEKIDSDFGLRHRAHEIVNDLFLLEFELRRDADS